MMLFEVADARVVHHWDGSLDGVASLWLSKERVPADGTREIRANWDGSLDMITRLPVGGSVAGA